jgi:hypothetical protein
LYASSVALAQGRRLNADLQMTDAMKWVWASPSSETVIALFSVAAMILIFMLALYFFTTEK